MIQFNYEIDFNLDNPDFTSKWISKVIQNEKFTEGEINYIFCSDDYLLKKNIKYLKHNTLTDIISFDYSMGHVISGDIFISIDRVNDNANDFKTTFDEELHRVIIHGVLHFIGYKDKTSDEKKLMREKEDHYLSKR